MDVTQALLKRKSVRAFLNKAIEPELIKQILHYARQSPSGTNTQPWQVAVVSGNTKKILDKQLEQLFWQQVPKKLDYNYYPVVKLGAEFQARRVECGALLYNTLGIDRKDKEQRLKQWALNYSGFGAPVTLYFFIDKILEKGSYMDYGMFLQSIMLMATELGLATCAQAALAEYPNMVKQILTYPADSVLLCGMALGYEDTNALVNSYRTSREEVDSFTKIFT
jgi:nitroreductase